MGLGLLDIENKKKGMNTRGGKDIENCVQRHKKYRITLHNVETMWDDWVFSSLLRVHD